MEMFTITEKILFLYGHQMEEELTDVQYNTYWVYWVCDDFNVKHFMNKNYLLVGEKYRFYIN